MERRKNLILGEKIFEDRNERRCSFLNTGYEKVFDELNNELTQLEAKPFYDLFKKLYCSNYSLRNELEQVSRRYYKLHEIVNNKSQCVERLYELLQVLSKPEVKILSLLKEVENGNTVSLEHTVVGIITNYEYSVLEEICKEFDCLVEQIKNDNVNRAVLESLYNHESDDENNIIKSDDRYWEVLRQYYYELRDQVFLDVSLTKIKNDLIQQNIVSARLKRSELVESLKQVRDNNYLGKRR